MEKKSPLVEAKGVSKDFTSPDGHSLHILENMNVKVYPQEILAIIGPSGCGKSTFIRILAGLIPATTGQIFSHGKVVKGLLPNFSLVFQNFALYPWMTVFQNIEMGLESTEIPEEEIKKRTLDAIAMIGLSGFEEAYPREISGGMKQRVGLARALVGNPELLLLDEPFSSLDTFTAEALRAQLLEIWANKGNRLTSIVMISHDVREVAFMADRIVMMEANPGRIRFVKENTLPRPRDYHSQEFLSLVDELHDAYSQEEKPPVEQPTAPLYPVSVEEIFSFLSYLRHYAKTKSLYEIGAGSMDHFDRVLMDADAAELLKFIEIANRRVVLTALGKKYLSADDQNRRLIWKGQLLTMPLFIKVVNWLKSAPKQTLSRKDLTDLIAKVLPSQDANKQCKTLINWGAYSNLFAYHRLSRTLSLKHK